MKRKTRLHSEETSPAHRFKMLTKWLTLTAFLAGSVSLGRAAFTVAPTCRVKGHPEAELSLNCGDGKNAGVVQYWHTPFGDLQTPGFHSKLDPVYMRDDGSLVVPNASIHHSGLHYCLLQHAEGTTLWLYELHVSHNTQKNQEHSRNEKCSSCDVFRFRRDVGSDTDGQDGGVSDQLFAGAVAASVLLTFVLGFSAGALSRTHILRCLGAITTRLRSPRHQQSDTLDNGFVVTKTTPVPRYNQAFEMEQVSDANSAKCAAMDRTSSSPPPKPQRSFRIQQQEQKLTTYLERCDYMKIDERRSEEVARSQEERSGGSNGEREGEGKEFYLLEDGGSQTETDEDGRSEEGVKKDGRESREEKKEGKRNTEAEEAHEQENRSKEGKRRGNKQRGREEKREETEGDGREKKRTEQSREKDISSEDDETGHKKKDTKKNDTAGGEPSSSSTCQGRRTRVIRLYQYDDDGQRYCHLPEPVSDEPVPAPRLTHRSVSLTRLSAIMAAASAGPLDTRETGRVEQQHFQMEI